VPVNDLNFPIETFYFDATTVASFGPDLGAKLTQVLALEGSYGTLPAAVQAGQEITFLRINTRVVGAGSLIPNSTYTVVHPYGTYTVTSDVNGDPVKVGGAGAFRAVDGCAGAPCDFSILLPAPTTGIGPWIIDTAGLHTDAATGNVYIGPGPLAATTITGSPLGTNFVSVTGPCANGGGAACRALPVVSTFRDDFFFLTGKVIGITASPGKVVFPTQKPAVVSAPVTVTITNPDSVNAALLGPAAVTGANVADFTIAADTCSNATLAAAGGVCTFGVTFSEPAPGVNGTKSAVISFPVTTPLNRPPVIINLSGAIDNIAPTVVSTIPANNAVNFPANNAISATFSEQVSNVTDTSFTLAIGGAPVTATVTYDAASKTATLTPAANLTANVTYAATVVGGPAGVADIAGNPLAADFVFSFQTTNADITPPAVVSTDPANNFTGAKATDPITATFNEAVLPSTVNATTFFLSDGVTGSVTYDPATRTATLKPAKALDFFHSYTATVTTGVKSLGNVPMAANYTWTFLTNGAPTAPKLYLPGDGATGVPLPVVLQWIKSKDVDGEPVTYHVWTCTNPSMVGCTPVLVTETTTTTAAAGSSQHNTLAGLGGYGAGMLLAGFAIVGGVRSRRKLFFFIAVLVISGTVATACKTKTVDNTPVVDPATIMSKTVSDLKSGTTYYWKVQSDDGNGALIDSEVRSFTTL
jgi:methionine-rich copper-binding protein CopC